MKDNRNREWTMQEDNALKHFIDLGYSSKKIYENYGDIFGRTEKAISCRISYLKKPVNERIKEDDNETDQDFIIESINQMCDRICNRLDTLTRQNEEMKKQIIEMNDRNEKRCDAYLKALYEIKTSASENAGDTKVMKNEVKRLAHKLVR